MGFLAGLSRVAAAGVLTVFAISLAFYLISRAFPADPSVYLIIWAFIAIPAALIVVGALAAREAYFACLDANQSIATSAAVALIVTVVGVTFWLLASRALDAPDQLRLYFQGLDMRDYAQIVFFLVTYAVAGAIGGIYDYFISRGRKCDIDRGRR